MKRRAYSKAVNRFSAVPWIAQKTILSFSILHLQKSSGRRRPCPGYTENIFRCQYGTTLAGYFEALLFVPCLAYVHNPFMEPKTFEGINLWTN
jgi:hypothetical protein